jgi:hypothetical protein
MAPSFPSERESECERLRTGLLTCAFEPPSQSRTPSVQLQWLKGQIRKVRKSLAKILLRLMSQIDEPRSRCAHSCGAVAEFHRLPEHPGDCCDE